MHKALCSKLSQFSIPPRPTARRAIVFPEDGEAHFAWIDTEMKVDEDDGVTWESPIISSHFGTLKIQPYYNNVRRSRRLKDNIDLRFRDMFLTDGSKPNKSIRDLVPEMSTGGQVWRGPLIALKEVNSYYDNNHMFPNSAPGYGHMDMGDFRDVVDYLTTWKERAAVPDDVMQLEMLKQLTMDSGEAPAANKSSSGTSSTKAVATTEPAKMGASKSSAKPSTSAPSIGAKEAPAQVKSATMKTFKGVRINCQGDIQFGRAQFEAVEVSIDIKRDRLTTPPLPTRLGLPIQLKKIPPPHERPFSMNNQSVTFLHLCADISNPDFGWAQGEWMDPAGSVIAIRPDGKELLPVHVEVLCNYCHHFLQPAFEDSMGSGFDPEHKISKEEVLYRISPKSFELFWMGFSNYKQTTDEESKKTYTTLPDLVKTPGKLKGLRENFRKLNRYL